MDIYYKRDLESNYLIVEDAALSDQAFTLRMIEANAPDSLLRLTVKRMNGQASLWYKVTGMQPLALAFERRSMTGRQIVSLLEGLELAMEDVRAYLLDPADVVLTPEWIFTDPGTGRVRFIYVSLQGEGEGASLKGLAEFILRKLDHTDPEAVRLGYGFYDRVSAQSEGFSQIWRALREEGGDEKERPAFAGGRADHTGLPETGGAWEDMEEGMEREQPQPPAAPSSTLKRRLRRGLLIAAVFVPVYALAVWLARLDLTQAGGLFFGMTALGWLLFQLWERRGEKSGDLPGNAPDEAGEEAFWEALSRDDALEGMDLSEEQGEKERGPVPAMEEETRFLGELDRRVRLVLISQDIRRSRDLEIESVYCVIGKSREQADLCIPLNVISRVHAVIEQGKEGIMITDLNSRNGTFVNRLRLEPYQKMKLAVGDAVSFATVHFKLEQRDY